MRTSISALMISLSFLISTPAFAVDVNEEDKAKHVQMSTGISAISYGAFRAGKFGKISSSFLAFSVAMTVGYIKELTDPIFDKEDLRADAIGSGIGIIIPMSFTF